MNQNEFHPMKRGILLAVGCVLTMLVAGDLSAFAMGDARLSPRMPMAKVPVAEQIATAGARVTREVSDIRLMVKFHDRISARVETPSHLHSLAGNDLTVAEMIASRHEATFLHGLALDEQRLQSLRVRAEARSGQSQPDLAGMIEVVMPPSLTLDQRVAVADEFQALEEVEFASLMSPLVATGDAAPSTPWMGFLQTYKHPDPGIDIDYAWIQGLRGAGVRVSDVEFAWNGAHEDLVGKDLHQEPGQTPTQKSMNNGGIDHGTAVMGELVALDNEYGCTGMVPEVAIYTYPGWTVEEGHREEDAAATALADSAAGDIVLTELSTGLNAPLETEAPFFLMMSMAVDAGVVVVEPAGNGNWNLDAALFSTYKSWGDSGAIIVGGGHSDSIHAKNSTSTYGSRVNVQGWAESVFSLGYGNFAEYGDDPNQRYTQSFSGTSSASPFIVAACAVLQQRAKESLLAPLDPLVLRQLLIDTGLPQGGTGGHIGPFPDIKAALSQFPTPWTVVPAALPGALGAPAITGKGELKPGMPFELDLAVAAPGANAWLVMGLSAAMVPFKHGLLVPFPDTIFGPLPVSPKGGIVLTGAWPDGIPAQTVMVAQWWIDDGSPHASLSATDGIVGLVP